MVRPRAQHDHHPRGLQRGEDVRLVGRAELILQRDAREEHAEPLLRQLAVQVAGEHAVRRAAAVGVRLLVAEEHVERRFPFGDLQDALLDSVDGLRLALVDGALPDAGMGEGGAVVLIVKDRGELRAVDRGDARVRRRVLHVFHAVAAQHERPVRLRVRRVLVEQLLVEGGRLVVLVVAAVVARPVVQVRPPVAVEPRQRLLRAAVAAHRRGLLRLHLQCAAAHLALKNSHAPLPRPVRCGFAVPAAR